jgi:hypothetical protein
VVVLLYSTIRTGGVTLLKKIRIILGIVVILLAGFGLITKNFVAQPIMMLSLSAWIYQYFSCSIRISGCHTNVPK